MDPAAPIPGVAIVLAAGRGIRMGGPKALLPVRGRPWWMEQAQRLRAAGVPALWVVNHRVRAAMAGARPPPDLDIADETAPMFSSLVVGLRTLAARTSMPPGVFVLPIDVPAPARAVWEALAGSGAPAAAPVLDGRTGHPVYLSWEYVRIAILPAAESESPRLDELIRSVVSHVPVQDRDVRANLNTPEALARWLARTGG
jgi:nicotine blue oxidoreductase